MTWLSSLAEWDLNLNLGFLDFKANILNPKQYCPNRESVECWETEVASNARVFENFEVLIGRYLEWGRGAS